jgi:tetratricopeptide (TPR) repeat protein|tara:strand:- start:57 stop:1445 length:1389 start_codon:yes stop_codon:yes gene_type:complete
VRNQLQLKGFKNLFYSKSEIIFASQKKYKMKKIAFLGILFLSFSSIAQAPSVSSAKIAFDRGDLVEAKKYIDEASVKISGLSEQELNEGRIPKLLPKFYLYRGNIYMALYTSPENTKNEYLDVVKESYNKCIEVEKKTGKKRYSKDAITRLPGLGSDYVKLAENLNFNEGDKAAAIRAYESAFSIREYVGVLDTMTLSYIGFLSQDNKDFKKAREIYEKLIQLDYKNITWSGILVEDGKRYPFPDKNTLDSYVSSERATDPKRSESTQHEIYIQLLWVLRELEEIEEYDRMLIVARNTFPKNDDLLKMQLQAYLDKEDYDGALSNLEEALTTDPTNALYLYNAGFIYHQKKKDNSKGREYYTRAMEADDKYLDAIYMLGLMHIDQSNVVVEKINKLGRSEKTKYNKYTKEKNDELAKALTFFEKAYGINSKDEATLEALKEVYYKLGKYDDAKRIMSELSEL